MPDKKLFRLVRIILKDVKIGLGQKKVFNTFHADASDLYEISFDENEALRQIAQMTTCFVQNRKKKNDQVVVEQIQQEEIVELVEDVEIIPDITETDLARNEMVVDADFIEEIPEQEIELKEVEEKPVAQEPKRPETPIEEPEEEELEAEVEPEPEAVEPEVVEEVKQQLPARKEIPKGGFYSKGTGGFVISPN